MSSSQPDQLRQLQSDVNLAESERSGDSTTGLPLNKEEKLDSTDPHTGVSHQEDPSYSFFGPRIYWPVIVIVIQLILFFGGWAFFGRTLQKPLPLNDRLAERAQRHFPSVTMVITLISSALSILSGFLYSHAIRYSLRTFLVKPLSLYTVAATIKVAQKKLIFDLSRLKWTIAAIVCSVVVGAQTAGWSTLLTPRTVYLESSILGFEIDLASNAFVDLVFASDATPESLQNILPVMQTSGAASAAAVYGLPSIFNFNRFSYVNSTGGILPANIVPFESTILPTTTLPVNTIVAERKFHPQGFEDRYIVQQQGFTGDVTCEQRVLNNSTFPRIDVAFVNETAFSAGLSAATMRVQCSASEETKVSEIIVTSPQFNAVLAASCMTTLANGTRRNDVVISGYGLYAFMNTSVCGIYPKTTTVDVEYFGGSQSLGSGDSRFVGVSLPLSSQDAPKLGQYATDAFLRNVAFSQDLIGNSFGNSLSTLFFSNSNQTNVNNLLEAYLTGILEFSGTLLRAYYTATPNGLYPGNSSVVPDNMRRSTNGTFVTETIGWYQDPETAPAVLLAPSFVTLLSVIIMLVTLIRSFGGLPRGEQEYFDPSNIIHVISAASAGGMNGPFPKFSDNLKEESKRIEVSMGPLNNGAGRVGFLRENV